MSSLFINTFYELYAIPPPPFFIENTLNVHIVRKFCCQISVFECVEYRRRELTDIIAHFNKVCFFIIFDVGSIYFNKMEICWQVMSYLRNLVCFPVCRNSIHIGTFSNFFLVFLTRILKFFAIIEEKKTPKKITNWRVVFNIT